MSVIGPTVECYSGYTYAQEPRALTWEGRRYLVAEVEARWRTPDGPAFRVRTEAGERFDLHYHELEDHWTIQVGASLVGAQGQGQVQDLPLRNQIEDKEVQP